MAKASKSTNNKTSFGKKKSHVGGIKSFNKSNPKPKAYRGQGRRP
jgi:hypothetical protein